MSSKQPLQFFLEITVPSGRESEAESLVSQIVSLTEEQDEGALSYHFFFNADRSRIYGIEIHADEAALVSHMETVGELAGKLFSFAKMERATALGSMSSDLKSALAPFNPVFHDQRIAGFTRMA